VKTRVILRKAKDLIEINQIIHLFQNDIFFGHAFFFGMPIAYSSA